jgi:PAS domain S-box-containing protein
MRLGKKVTERTSQLAEVLETLKTSEEKYHEIVENTSDVVHTTDNKNFTYINPACQKLTGFTQKIDGYKYFRTYFPRMERTGERLLFKSV